MKQDIKSMLPEELEEHFMSLGEKRYRAQQVFSWLHKGVSSFDEMTDLPIDLRGRLSEGFYISALEMLEERRSSSDGTIKYLWGLQGDGTSGKSDAVESVLMDYKHGTTVCISTQAGCRMGCAFCASAIGGLSRGLTPSEMLDQVLFSARYSEKTVSNIVLMGIGEPLDNFENVMRFVTLVTHPKGLGTGARHLTLSTCGILEGIDRLADCGVKLSLAISLHAPDDDTRNNLVPQNRHTGVKALIDAARRYTDKTGRRVSFEYAMIDEVNDSPQQAKLLSALLRDTGSHLNLILLSAVPERSFKASKKESLEAFSDILLQNGVNFTTRRSLGADIEASCGQLRRKSLK